MAAKTKNSTPRKGARKGAGKLKVAKAAAKNSRSSKGGTSVDKTGAAKAARPERVVSTPDWAKATRYIFRSGS